MAKRGSSDGDDILWMKIVVLGVIAVFVYTFFSDIPVGGPILSKLTGEVTTTTVKTGSTTTIIKPDLIGLTLPYLHSSTAPSDCIAGGGTWTTKYNFVGCTNFVPGTIVCSKPLVTAAGIQCEAVGAEWVCDPNNIYCRYT